jgi:hypothetical protein
MTAAPVDQAAASRLVAALEHAWTAIRRHHPEVPQAVIVVASGSDPRSRRLNLGHFAAGRWQLTSPDAASDRAEVLVSGEGLQRGPVDVLGTLLHEAAHGLAYTRNALACSCGCGRRIRVARSVLELAPILCASCAQPFEPDDDPR